ncbi:MAG: hypothetical protein LUD68_07430 [Rikenellaceae bacterium]|nr:hypothetical protein [Rikenellaceae bacterium]
MGIVFTGMILVVGGFFLWTRVIHPYINGRYARLATVAEQEYAIKGEEMKREAFENPEKFGIFSRMIPAQEKIVAIASLAEWKGLGKIFPEEARTSSSPLRNLHHHYLILTDKSLHSVGFDGERSVWHEVFDQQQIQHLTTGKTGGIGSMFEDALPGMEGDFDRLCFTYHDKKYEFNLDKFVSGYPIFEVKKDVISESFYRIYKVHGESNVVYDYRHIAFYLENKLRTDLYNDFKKAIGERYRVEFPVD